MIVQGASREQIEEAAELCGLKIRNLRQVGAGWGFRLGLGTKAVDGRGYEYQRVRVRVAEGGKPRRIGAVCWHGHRDFMRRLYAEVPKAKIKTPLITYTGAINFEHSHRVTAPLGAGCNCYAWFWGDWQIAIAV